ncbi:MscL family protein [Cyclobacterium amurskyense]|uniref:MscL family protein n=1 Tax=Cyclobacterium amurskyense TaxID=320787 RepID=UPI000A0573B3|nr:MscL family protein [Cyclobacterium amurskyense]
MPPLSFLTNGINWENKKLILRQELISGGVIATEEFAIGYGKVLEASVVFLIIGFTIFFIVKLMNSIKKKAEDPKNNTITTPKNIELLNRMTVLMERQVELWKREAIRILGKIARKIKIAETYFYSF